MRILCVIDSLNSGGAQRQLVNLAIGFKEEGHDVAFLVYHKLDFHKKILDEKNISVNYVVESNYILRMLKMRRFIRNGNYDTVLSFLEASNFICEISGFPRRKWKLVVGERSANPNILRSVKLITYRWFHVFADYVVSNSYANLTIIKKANPFLPLKKIRVIYNMVSFKIDSISPPQEKALTNICIGASYDELKNLDGLIDAVNLLPTEYRNKLRIDWFGRKLINGRISNSLLRNEEKIKNYNLASVVKLNDAVADILEVYKYSDFVALLSHHEGFPNSICEAMALGKPIIASNVSDIPNIIKDGKNGFLCESKSITSIKECLINAIDSDDEKRQKMGEYNLTIADKLFDKKLVVDRYLQLMR